jgi:dolichyl-phosphate-mannose--protein O-mannosyl transferase
MTIRTALIFYVSTIVLAIAVAWFIGYAIAWWAGMAVLTVLVLEHAWRVVKRIRQNQP